jgi:ribosomal protein L40E
MPAFYSHISTEQLDEKLIQLYSGKPVETKPKFVLVKCPRCGADNTPGANYCTKCGSPLNPEEIAKAEVEPQLIREYEERLRKLSEELETLKQKLKGFEGKLKKTLK